VGEWPDSRFTYCLDAMSFGPLRGFLDEDANASTVALIYDTSVSLDGFITGPEPGRDYPLGKGGDELHEWMSG
jgi:hypothetical protein